jgi:hypothetical protein
MEAQDDPPQELVDRPTLHADLAPVWEAFWILNSSRASSMSVGAIPLSEITSYWKDLIGVSDRTSLWEKVSLVRKMDEQYLKIAREKSDGV